MGSNNFPEYLPGFPDCAAFLASSRDLAIFRRFDTIANRNLLYLQDQLISLEKRLGDLDKEDKAIIDQANATPTHESMSVQQASQDWDSFKRRSRSEPRQVEKLKIVLEIRSCLQDFEDALIRRSALFQMQPPDEGLRSILADFCKNQKPFVNSLEDTFRNSRDVVSIQSSTDRDRLRRCIEAGFGYFFKEPRDIPRSWEDIKGVYYFPEDGGIARLVSITSVLLATLLLFGAVAVLNFVSTKRHGLRIGIIGAFTFAFAITVGILTNAKRVELFGAVAAYSAVLVVFSTVNIESD